MKVGNSVLMLSEASTAYPPGCSVNFAYVTDVYFVFPRRNLSRFVSHPRTGHASWVDRIGGFHDPFDNRWFVATRVTT